MKRYRVEYWDGDSSNIFFISQILKTGKCDKLGICFFEDGKKCWQEKIKNSRRHGLYINWYWMYLENWKKGNERGIKIKFNK